MYRTDFWTLWEKARVGCFERTELKHVYYLWWNRSPAQVGCMRQVLGPGSLGRPRGIGWRGRWEGGSGWGIHVNPWLIYVNVWQKPLQYCKVISLHLIKKKIGLSGCHIWVIPPVGQIWWTVPFVSLSCSTRIALQIHAGLWEQLLNFEVGNTWLDISNLLLCR